MKLNRASNWLRPAEGRALPRWRRRGMVIMLAAPLVAIVTACASTNTPTGDVALSTPQSSASAASASSSPSAEASPSPSVAAVVITSAPPPLSSAPAVVVAQPAAPAVTTHAAAPPVVHTTHAAPPVHTTAAAPAKPSTCGAPSNPYGYNFCGRGGYVTSPPAEICSYFNCIANFFNGHGYMVECNDGTYSMSGGIRGACSYHKGEDRAVDGG